MNSGVTHVLTVPLDCDEPQLQALAALQLAFSQACNLVAEQAQRHRCWNRVALHHLSYRLVRQAFEALGSQMACNAVYAVCRACRWAYQHPQSPYSIEDPENSLKPLPLLRFTEDCPVYFDRHTFTVKAQSLSLYTLDGRMQFLVSLTSQQANWFKTERVKEAALVRASPQNSFQLVFWFEPKSGPADAASAEVLSPSTLAVGPLKTQPHYLETVSA